MNHSRHASVRQRWHVTGFLLLLVATAACCQPAPTAAAAENWPEFRGPRGDGTSLAQGLPTHWSETQNIRWKTPIHDKGHSSPVVWGDRIWLTTAKEDGKKLYVLGLDAADGRIVHDIELFQVDAPDFCHEMNSYASCTPVVEPGRLYVHFGCYGTACLDTASGAVLWSRRDLDCDHHRGPGSSPIVFENLLLVHYDGFDVQYVVAFDKATGQTVWKRDRNIKYSSNNGDLKKAYGTPAVFQINGQPQLISPSAEETQVFNPRTGELLWHVQHGGMNVSARPLMGHGLIYLNTGAGGLKMLAVRPDGQGNVTDSHIAWTFAKSVPTRPSKILVNDLLFMINDGGVATCLDAKSGEQVWSDRVGGNFSGSPISAEGRVYLFDENGQGHVIRLGRQYELLTSNRLNDGCLASPAVYQNSLLVRTRTHLYRIEQK